MAKKLRRHGVKRGECPSCGKRGLKLPRTYLTDGLQTLVKRRECMYCGEVVETTKHFDAPHPAPSAGG